jgi:SAM-dependent methyltransferase
MWLSGFFSYENTEKFVPGWRGSILEGILLPRWLNSIYAFHSMPRFLCLLIGFQLMLLEMLTLRGLSTLISLGPIFIVLPAVLCGGALGSALLAARPSLVGVVARFASEGFALAAILAAANLLLLPNFTLEFRIAWPVPVLCLASAVIWGMLFTSYIQRSEQPVRLMLFSALGSSLAVLCMPLYRYLPFSALLLGGALTGFIPLFTMRPNRRTLALRAVLVAAMAFIFYRTMSDTSRSLIIPLNIEKTYANSFSLIEVTKFEKGLFAAEASSGDPEILGAGDLHDVNVYAIYRNGRRATFVLDALNLEDLAPLRNSSPYRLLTLGPRNSIALVGPGGGQEIALARLAGFREITAIEINPAMVTAASEFCRNPALTYGAPEVHTVIQDARFYFRHLPPDKKFDVIMLKNVKNYGAPGIEFFNENYVFTSDAFHEYADHLAPGGKMIVKIDAQIQFLRVLLHSLRSGLSTQSGELYLDVGDLSNQDHRDVLNWENGVLSVFHKGKMTSGERSALKGELADYSVKKRFALPGPGPGPEIDINSDNRPYPFWLRTRLPALWTMPLLFMGVLSFLRLPLRRDRETGAAKAILTCAFLSGFGYTAVEVVFAEHAVFISGDPEWAPPITMLVFLLASVFVYWIAEVRKLSVRSSALSVFAIPALIVMAWFVLSGVERWPLSSAQFTALCAAMLGIVASFASWVYLGLFNRIMEVRPRWLAHFLASNGLGALCGGVGAKLVCVDAGKNVALALVVFGYVLLAVVCPRKESNESAVFIRD